MHYSPQLLCNIIALDQIAGFVPLLPPSELVDVLVSVGDKCALSSRTDAIRELIQGVGLCVEPLKSSDVLQLTVATADQVDVVIDQTVPHDIPSGPQLPDLPDLHLMRGHHMVNDGDIQEPYLHDITQFLSREAVVIWIISAENENSPVLCNCLRVPARVPVGVMC